MIENILRRFRRAPLQALAVVLLAAVLSAALCGLVKAGQVQQEKYEEMYDNIPVYLRVTNLSATRWDDLECPRWVMDAFTGFGFGKDEVSLKDYVKEVHAKMSVFADSIVINGETLEDVDELVGISGTIAYPELHNSKAGIEWFEGFDESVFSSKEAYCIIPGSMMPDNWNTDMPLDVEATVSYSDGSVPAIDITVTYSDGFNPSKTATRTLRVVGTHSLGSGLVFTSLDAMKNICASVDKPMEYDAVTAILSDNDLQEEVRQAAYIRFAEPNATGEHTSWKWNIYFWYPYALDIDNSLLVNAEMSLKTSLLMGQVCSYLLFVLSAGAGFFVGFLMIRARRREIALMRSMGNTGAGIFAGLAVEQLLCVAVGTIIGGAAFLWQPVERLEVFVAVYALGLALALLVFLNRNLMTALKEEE